MAKVGLRYPVFKSSTSKGVIGKAIQADISITVNEVNLPADDAIAETDRSFQSGKISLGVDDLSDTIQKELLGHNIDVSGEITANGDDVGAFVGIGFYGVKRVNNVNKFRAIWLTKVQFSEPNDNNSTKGENTSFSTPTLEGTIMLDDSNNWKQERTFDTVAQAKAYLDSKAGITEKCTTPVVNIAAGTYSTAQNVTLTAGSGEDIYYTTNGTTPSASNGTKYTAAVSISQSKAIRAIAIKAGKSPSDVANYEYIITA